MRRLIALLSVAALVMCASAAAADFPLRLVAQTATTITLGWDARANVVNYTFFGDSVRSGIRNSTVYWCGTGAGCGGGEAIAFTANGSPAVNPVNENNTLVLSGG